MQSQTV